MSAPDRFSALELLPLVHPDLRFNEAVFLLNAG
jgi:hypothetical protein